MPSWDVRGIDGWKELGFEINGTPLRVAVAQRLGQCRRLVEALRRGQVHYDFVEVMACPGGCAGGGRQPIHDGQELARDAGRKALWAGPDRHPPFLPRKPGHQTAVQRILGSSPFGKGPPSAAHRSYSLANAFGSPATGRAKIDPPSSTKKHSRSRLCFLFHLYI